MSTVPHEDYRAQFAVPEGIYMLNHSVGCLPHVAREAALTSMQHWAEQGGDAWWAWLDEINGFRDSVATLLGSQRAQVCPQLNVSSALTKLIGALPRERGRSRIVLTELDFPTIGYVCEHARPEGVEVVYIPDVDGTLPLEQWEHYLTEETWFTVITHSYSSNSFLAPVAEISRLANSLGAYAIADIAQSAGVVPVEPQAWGCDVAIGSSVKWLCGGSGACFLWLREGLIDSLEPSDVGWFSSAEPFNYDIHSFSYAPDALRFWGGTPLVLTYGLAAASIGLINDIGPGRIRAHNQALTRQLVEGALASGLKVTSPHDPAQRGGTVAIDLGDNAAAASRLRDIGIRVDHRPRFGLRFSPHIYNSAGEIEDILKVL